MHADHIRQIRDGYLSRETLEHFASADREADIRAAALDAIERGAWRGGPAETPAKAALAAMDLAYAAAIAQDAAVSK
jgi:hypothetical protein